MWKFWLGLFLILGATAFGIVFVWAMVAAPTCQEFTAYCSNLTQIVENPDKTGFIITLTFDVLCLSMGIGLIKSAFPGKPSEESD